MVLASCHVSPGMSDIVLPCAGFPRPRGRQEGKKAPRRARTDLPVPDRNKIYADMAALFLRDLANVEAGFYPLPVDHDGISGGPRRKAATDEGL